MRLWAIIALCVFTIAFGAALGVISYVSAMSHPAPDTDMAAFTKSVNDDARRLYLMCVVAYAALLALTVFAGRKRGSKRTGS